MNLNWIGLLAACGCVAVFFTVYTKIKHQRLARRIALMLVSSVCGIPAMMTSIYYLHILPEWPWFYEMRSWRGSEGLVLPLACAAACFATFFPRWLLPPILSGVIVISMMPYLKPLISPLMVDGMSDRWEGSACMQTTGSTCGPASIATIMARHGVRESEREIARQAYTCASGTEAWYLARLVRSKDLKAKFDFRPGMPANLRLPAMVGVKMGATGHFIAVLSREDNEIHISDPLFGMRSVKTSDFEKAYKFSGFHLSINKNE